MFMTNVRYLLFLSLSLVSFSISVLFYLMSVPIFPFSSSFLPLPFLPVCLSPLPNLSHTFTSLYPLSPSFSPLPWLPLHFFLSSFPFLPSTSSHRPPPSPLPPLVTELTNTLTVSCVTRKQLSLYKTVLWSGVRT